MAQWLSERGEPGTRLGQPLPSVTAYPMTLTTQQTSAGAMRTDLEHPINLPLLSSRASFAEV